MVKIDEIPEEEPRVDLSELPQENILLATAEKVQAATADKTGGVVITFKQKDGRQFPQKYSKISGAALIAAMKKLEYTDTKSLFDAWHKYKLTPMRTGYPRYLPTEKVK